MDKVLILQSFHRFVFVAEGERERRENFPAGKTVEVSEEDAALWIAKGLAKAASAASSGPAGAEAGDAV